MNDGSNNQDDDDDDDFGGVSPTRLEHIISILC